MRLLKYSVLAEAAELRAEIFFENENYFLAKRKYLQASRFNRKAGKNLESERCESIANHLECLIDSFESLEE
jgi:hypothetical protein